MNSTTTKEARTLGGPPTGELPPSGVAVRHQATTAAVAETEQAAAAAVPASEKHQWVILKAPSANIAQTASAQHRDEGNPPEVHTQNSHSNQSSGSHQERRLNQGSLAQSGSHGFRVTYDEAMPIGEGPDSGSDSADTSSQGVKRSRCVVPDAVKLLCIAFHAQIVPTAISCSEMASQLELLVKAEQYPGPTSRCVYVWCCVPPHIRCLSTTSSLSALLKLLLHASVAFDGARYNASSQAPDEQRRDRAVCFNVALPFRVTLPFHWLF